MLLQINNFKWLTTELPVGSEIKGDKHGDWTKGKQSRVDKGLIMIRLD